jgi:hypothetical protein
MTGQRGSCLCGEAAYEAEGPLEHAHHCHCAYCRKAHGTPYATGAMARDRRWLRGESRVASFESSPGFRRWFCRQCGSSLPGDPVEGATFVPFGTLDGDPGVRPHFHIFVAAKAPWWEIRDELRRFDHFPPGIDAPVAADLPPRDPAGATRGSCLCGAVAFQIEGNPFLARSCHCGRCRKARSAAHATNMLVPVDALRFTRGEGELATYKIPEAQFYTQVFCRICGAKAPRIDRGREHIFVGSKAPWDEIYDDQPRFDGPAPIPPPPR